MELGSVTLKRIGFFCFPIKHSTHTVRYGTRLGDLKENWTIYDSMCEDDEEILVGDSMDVAYYYMEFSQLLGFAGNKLTNEQTLVFEPFVFCSSR